jgi:iron complex outermembrane receptor protein
MKAIMRNKVKALIGYKASCGFSVSYIGKYYGSTYAGNDVSNDKEKIDSYMISDLKVGYKIKNADIYLKVNNIFNEKYYDYAFKSAFSESYYPAPERNFMAGVSYKF